MSEHPGAQKGANVARKRNALGRGLSALMSASAVSVRESAASREVPAPPNLEVLEGRGGAVGAGAVGAGTVGGSTATGAHGGSAAGNNLEGGLIYLSIDRVFASKNQPRKHFVQAEIDSLAESIHKTGLLSPILVRRRAGEVSGQLATYEIIAGERRWRAAKQAGLVKIPALLRQISDRESLELGIVENVQRSDLNAIEEAAAYQRLSDEFGANHADIAATVGKDRASVANAVRLLKLAAPIQEMIVRGELSAGHGRAVLMIEGAQAQLVLAKKIASESLSVRAAERLAGALKNGSENLITLAAPKTAERPNPNAAALEERFRRALGTKVRLQLSKDGGGELRINFFSAAELERLLEKVGA